MTVLLLLHPTVVTDPTLAEQSKKKWTQDEEVTQHIIDRVANKVVELPQDHYSKVVYINPNEGEHRNLPTQTIEQIFGFLQHDGVFCGDLPTDQNLDALMAGFVVEDDKWLKPKPVQSVAIPLKRKGKVGAAGQGSKLEKLPMFKKLDPGMTDTSASNTDEDESALKRKLQESKLLYFSDSDNDDELVNEDDLIDNSALNYNLVVPKRCELPNGKKRRKACKDCTCGLKELEESEDNRQRSLQDQILGKMAQLATQEAIEIEKRLAKSVKFTEDELTEIDFTVEGKTGGCNSCALGDAFRCDGCPYLGLPPFKPGQAITIDSIDEDWS